MKKLHICVQLFTHLVLLIEEHFVLTIINKNTSANRLRSKFYVCPVCGNAIHSTGNAETRLQLRGVEFLYYYCNRHGLLKKKV